MHTLTHATAYVVATVYHVGPFEEQIRYIGPFPDVAAACAWMNAQSDDPDVLDMNAFPMNAPDTGIV
jgi:hypothetical protein